MSAPGSPAFDTRLAERLRTLPTPLRIQDRWRHSRNTLLYRLVTADGGEGTWIAKAYCTKPAWQLVEEHRVLQALAARLPAGDVRSLEPVAVWEDLGVAVTREVRGTSLLALLTAANGRGGGSVDEARLAGLLERAAHALFAFHQAFGIAPRDGVERSRMYLDFSPVNLLVPPGGEGMVLLDPPEFDEEGEVHADLGTFCFELSRAGLRPEQVLRYAHGRVPALKAAFVRAYFARLGRPATAADLARVARHERARARQVLGWYVPFWRYRSPVRELARACWFVPAILFYDRVMMPGTYAARSAGAE